MISIRTRLLTGLMLLMAAASLLAGGIAYRRSLQETSDLFDYQLRQMALSLRDEAALAAGIVLPPHAPDTDFVVQIWDLSGARLYYSGPADHPFINQAILGYSNLILQGRRWRVYSLNIDEGVIQVAQPWSVRERLARDVALRVSVPLLLLLPLLALGAAWTVQRALRPLRQVAAEVERRDAHSLAPIQAPQLPAEVAPLVDELNRLLARLQEAFASQRAFVADAAHELRSPLTALSLQLQLLERARDGAESDTARRQLRAAIERATHLVGQLLALARNDNEPGGTSRGTPVPVSLATVAHDAAADVQAFADSRGTILDLQLPASTATPAHLQPQSQPAVGGDPDALRMLARNLIDNAVRYSPPGSRVTVRVLAQPTPALTVEDQGAGIPAADRERVFDRFYRRAGSSENGTGLGLAIVSAIARRHGARIDLGDARPHGLRVTITFPASATQPQ